MRRLVLALLLVSTLMCASPALAAETSGSLLFRFERNFTTGARFVGETISGWMRAFLSLVGLEGRLTIVKENEACTQKSRCDAGLVCLNVCDRNDCEAFEKRCVRGPTTVTVLGLGSICGPDNVCADGTSCARVCPQGGVCDAAYRCLKPSMPIGRCAADADCKAICSTLPPPAIGPSAQNVRCVSNTCVCNPIEITPNLPRVACPASGMPTLACPEGTQQACAGSISNTLYATCLTAPEYGGSCYDNDECAAAACPEGATPFCGDDKLCKCRRGLVQIISCNDPTDCSATGCKPTEIAACIAGACACAPAGNVTACRSVSDCSSDCPQGYAPACENEACVCQRRTENVPVACQTVAQCGSVSCPTGYEKTCLNAVCACARTQQPL